jgi:exosortase H (IPTLxxWG-CTERM-specific)
MSPSWIFILRFSVASLAQFALLLAAPLRPSVDRFSEYLAAISAGLIRLFGGACEQSADILSVPGETFRLEILDGCNGVNVVILLWAALIAYPAPWKWRLIGMFGGLVAIQSFNLLRIISLFYLGQFSREAFDFAHLYLWETLIILDAILVFGLWSRRVR